LIHKYKYRSEHKDSNLFIVEGNTVWQIFKIDKIYVSFCKCTLYIASISRREKIVITVTTYNMMNHIEKPILTNWKNNVVK